MTKKTKDKDTGEEKTPTYFRVFYVWSLDQCEIPEDHLPEQLEKIEFDPIPRAEDIISGYSDSPEIRHGLPSAF
jgi:hypothetical protein